MLQNFLTDIKGSHFDLAGFAKSQPNKRVINRERLEHLEWIEIVTKPLIGEIQAGADYCHVSDRSFQKHSALLHISESAIDSETRKNGRINRDAAIAKNT